MDWEELIGLFVDERVDFILGKGGMVRYSRQERKLLASLDEETRKELETAAGEQAEQEAEACGQVYRQAFLDGLFVGAQAFGSHGKEGREKKQP